MTAGRVLFVVIAAVSTGTLAAACGGLLTQDDAGGIGLNDSGGPALDAPTSRWCDFKRGAVNGPDAYPHEYIFECTPVDLGGDVFVPTTCAKQYDSEKHFTYGCCFSGIPYCCPLSATGPCDAYP